MIAIAVVITSRALTSLSGSRAAKGARNPRIEVADGILGHGGKTVIVEVSVFVVVARLHTAVRRSLIAQGGEYSQRINSNRRCHIIPTMAQSCYGMTWASIRAIDSS